MRRNVVEKYYDCLQCAEQCRHTVLNNNNNSTNSGSINNNNIVGNSNNNGSGSTTKKSTIANNVNDRTGSNLDACSIRSKDSIRMLTPYNDSIRRHKARSNDQLVKYLSKNHQIHLTPARKRSSLARPVRVHDSFIQSKKFLGSGYAVQQHRQYQQYHQRQLNQQHQLQHQRQKELVYRQDSSAQRQGTSMSDYAYEDEEHIEEITWPIRLRLEQMLELTLSQAKRRKKKKKKKTTTMMLMKQEQSGRNGFKDTERLLKVLSINNVDQDNRYNVKRCSIM